MSAVQATKQTDTAIALLQELESSVELPLAGQSSGRLFADVHQELARLRRRVANQERQQEQLRAMQQVTAAINSSLDPARVLDMVMDAIISLARAERGFLMLFDEGGRELKVKAARNINGETIGGSDFEISRAITQEVAATGRPLLTTGAQGEPGSADDVTHFVGYSLRSILCVPLKSRENVIGVIYADNRIANGIFRDRDRDVLATFADQAAVAIENARLFRQFREQLADLTELKSLQDNVFESMASGVITLDAAGRVSLYNLAAERILGVPAAAVLNQPYDAMLIEPFRHPIKGAVKRVMGSGRPHSLELDVRLPGRSGRQTLRLSLSPMLDSDRKPLGVAVVIDDVTEARRLESVRRYLPPALVDQVRDVDAAQEPQRRELTVFFADLRGFTTLSEQWQPELLVEVLNGYLSVAARVINDHGGLIDKYDGDAIMALFNTPLNPQEDHAERAVESALALAQELAAFRRDLAREHRLHYGVGIHTGEAVVGNLGGPLRKDYSAVGDAVNLAKRLQEAAAADQVLVSEALYRRVESWATAESLGPMQVKGRRAVEQVYALSGR